ncbi:unnamed protein product [Thelazia callipaeda]|uniref:PUM-HD domain-containing protein n=1 Tax=Thelazia callipaeda TaxID=103827 RepID=A0A0N5CKG8_THECL|nr:unnamed protein product [Thelazia callipaeda]
MTRKRKSNVITGSNCQNKVDSYGSSLVSIGGNTVYQNQFMKDFESRYGPVEHSPRKKKVERRFRPSSEQVHELDVQCKEIEKLEDTAEYPSEIVEYMKQVLGILESDPSISGGLREKCLNECQGFEISLLMYDASSRLVGEIFTGYRNAAKQWFLKILQSSSEIVMQLLCMPSACRTFETLLYSLSYDEDMEIVQLLADIIIGNWWQLISDKNACYFIRSLTYHLIGVKRKKMSRKGSFPDKDIYSLDLSKINPIAKEIFKRIASVALDYISMKDLLDEESVSLVLQDVVECNSVFRTEHLQNFIEAGCKDSMLILQQWKGKQASHLWEIIVQKTNEDLRQKLYHSVLNSKLFDLSIHGFANFPVQKYIMSAKSDELIADISDELMNHFEDICASCKWGVIIALVNKACNRIEVNVVKMLRSYFKCGSKSARLTFVPNVFTLNTEALSDFNDTRTFDVSKGQLYGSLILQELVQFEHNKTVVLSLKSLSSTTILELAGNQKGSFLLQAVFRSSTILRADKELLAEPLKFSSYNLLSTKFRLQQKWYEVLSGNVSSHIFDVLWDCLYSTQEKEKLMDALSRTTLKSTRTLRLMCTKLDLRGFREQRKKWLENAKTVKPKK